jgi:hypothetical protein
LVKETQGILGVKSQKASKKFPCYKRYKSSRKVLDEKAKCQPWTIKKKPKFG